MTSFGKDVPGFFEEPTTYRHDFCIYPALPRSAKGMAQKYLEETFKAPDQSSKHLKLPKTITSYDTLQRLDYKSRLPFNAIFKPKEIVCTDPRQTFCKRIIEDEGLEEAIKTRPRQYVSPAISLDNVQEPNTRKLMVDFTYTTTTSHAGKEAWSNFHSRDPCLPNTVFEKTVDPLAMRLKLLSDLPAGFEASARKWDRIQERYYVDKTAEFLKRKKNIDCEKSLKNRGKNLITEEEKAAVRDLIKENKLRLPYDKMLLSYGGFRPQFADEVPLEVRKSSPFDPRLSVARAITARL